MTDAIHKMMNSGVGEGVFPSAQLLVTKNGRTLLNEAYGNATTATIFDIASLTKPVCTTSLLIQLAAEDEIGLDDPLSRFMPQCQCDTKTAVTIRHLLSHSSGLPAWQPYYQTVPTDDIGTPSGKLQIIEAVCREPLVYQTGFQSIYSDIGFILLGEIIERVTKKSLDKLFEERIARPLGLNNTFFVPLHLNTSTFKHLNTSSFAPTEDCPWRGKVIQGEVHDQNCYAMGGIAGHAGLFSTSADINKFITAFVESYTKSTAGVDFSTPAVDLVHVPFLSHEVIERFLPFRHRLTECNSTWLLGWDTPEHANSQAGIHFSKQSIGHLGYTGCSMWIDLEKDFWVVLLTNRIHPTTTNAKIRSFRPMLYNMIYEEMIA